MTDPAGLFDPVRTAPLTHAVEGPSAWYGEDLRKVEDWIHPLSGAEIGELEAAAEGVLKNDRAGGTPLIEAGAGEFPLPRLGLLLRELRDEVLNGRGFAVLRGLPVARYSIEEQAAIFWGIGAHLGKARSQNGKGHLLGHVRSLGYNLNDPTVRVYQTTERQTYHTDSCDMVALLCLQTAKSGGLSSLVSSMTVYNEILARRPDLTPRLFDPMAVDRREEVPEGRQPYFILPVYHYFEGYLSAIYARRYIESAQRFPEVPRLTDDQREALDLLDALANDERLHLNMEFLPGDMQFVHNHTLFHDRTAYEDWDDPERSRHLLRLWLSPPEARPLPPAYADRYGSVTVGDRGGIVTPGMKFTLPLEAE
ncbi:MAG: TauD/TfdA family dioxygenase [SAR324 cluster bacterium]|nr:TauD/TfdA family dioxygenase [SAR324 cluster bacterium]